MKPFLTLGFATRNDPGAWFTAHALFTYHPEIIKNCEILIYDNSTDENIFYAQEKALRQFCRIIRDPGENSSCIWKERMIQNAEGDFVVCMDSHVFFEPGCLKTLYEYFEKYTTTNDLIMGPLMKRRGEYIATQQVLYEWEPEAAGKKIYNGMVFGREAAGMWATDDRGTNPTGEPYEIQQNGTGFFAFRKETWPGFLPTFWGHGGNETYLMERYRERGDRVLCHPGVRWIHNFSGIKHAGGKDGPYNRTANYLKGAVDLDNPQFWEACRLALHQTWPITVDATISEFPIPPGLVNQLPRYPGMSVTKPLFHEIRRRVKPGMKTIEFGCGYSTLAFDAYSTDHTAVEDVRVWIDRTSAMTKNVNYQYAPQRDGWYSWEPEGEYDLILIDGPFAKDEPSARKGILSRIKKMSKPSTVIIIDDTHREVEKELSQQIAKLLGRKIISRDGQPRKFDVLVVPNQKYDLSPATPARSPGNASFLSPGTDPRRGTSYRPAPLTQLASRHKQDTIRAAEDLATKQSQLRKKQKLTQEQRKIRDVLAKGKRSSS